MRRIFDIVALVAFTVVLLLLAYFGPSTAGERERWPADLGCASVEVVMNELAKFFVSVGILANVDIVNDPVTGDVMTKTTAPGIENSLNHRFVNGCLYEVWEEPPGQAPASKPLDGTPA